MRAQRKCPKCGKVITDRTGGKCPNFRKHVDAHERAECTTKLQMPGESCDGMRVKIISRARIGEAVYVELMENRDMPDGSPGWKIGDRLQVKASEVMENR